MKTYIAYLWGRHNLLNYQTGVDFKRLRKWLLKQLKKYPQGWGEIIEEGTQRLVQSYKGKLFERSPISQSGRHAFSVSTTRAEKQSSEEGLQKTNAHRRAMAGT